MTEIGLRERKKANTRALIVETADRFFMARGFDNVTLDDVAAVCSVSVRTVLRYFDTKEALGLSHDWEAFERFKAGLDKRTGDVLGFWRYHLGMEVADFAARPDWHRKRYRMIHGSPLYLGLLGIRSQYRDELARALREEVAEDDRLTPVMLASLLTAGQDVVLMSDWLRGEAEFDPHVLLEVIDYAADLFAPRLLPRRGSGESVTD